MKLTLKRRFVLSALLAGWVCLAISSARISLPLEILAGSVCAIVIAAAFAQRPSHSIARLARRVKRLAAADWSSQTTFPTGDDTMDALLQASSEAADTMRKRREEADRQVAETENILDDLADAVIAVDPSGRVTWLNRSAGLFFGQIPHHQLVGRTVLEATVNHALSDMVKRSLETRAPVDELLDLHSPRERELSVTVIPRIASGGEFHGAVLVLHDVSEARRVDRMRRDFVGNASHELRTPVTAIQVMAESLLGGAMDDAVLGPQFVRSIVDSAQRLTRLADDLLYLNSHESSSALATELVDLGDVAREACEKLLPQAQGRRVVLECRPGVGGKVTGDRLDLWRAAANLVDNAIRYSNAGDKVEVWTEDSPDQVRFVVKDTGIGIPQDQQEKIFERFYRVDVARSRESGGTGLGLSIVKHIVDSHRGWIELNSAIGQGSTFAVVIPKSEGWQDE